MRVLIVGAGAVGLVYGRHLQKGGAEVSFFVKERHAAEARAGFTLYPLRRRGEKGPVTFNGFGVVTDVAQVAATTWDSVWMCISSTALRGAWLVPFLEATGDATLVSLTPALDDRALLLGHVSADRIVGGVITLVSYQAPLPNEVREPPGVAYWFPPFSASPFDGTDARVLPIVETLRRGGCPAKRQREAWHMASFASAVMMPTLVALEASGWSLRGLRRGNELRVSAAAAREALRIVSAYLGRKPPRGLRLLARAPMLRLVLCVAPRFVPFDLEAYFAYHFTKVGAQTRLMIRNYVDRGQALGLPAESLGQLARLLGD